MLVRLRPPFGLVLLFVLALPGCGLLLDFGPPDPQDAGIPCNSDADCDDQVQCTRDRCQSGRCSFEPRNDYCTLDPTLYPCEEPTCIPDHAGTNLRADGCVVVPNHTTCGSVSGDCGIAVCVGESTGDHNDLGCAVHPTACASTTDTCVTIASGPDLSGTCTALPSCATVACASDPCAGTITCDPGSSMCMTDGVSPCTKPSDPCLEVYCARVANEFGYACLTRESPACYGL